MKWTRTVLTSLLALSTLTTAAMATPPQVMNVLINPNAKGVSRPVAVAHRGVFMTGGPLLAENTVEAIARGYSKFGYRAFEIDLKNLKDGVPIVMHDASAGRTTSLDGSNGKYQPRYSDKVVDGDTGRVIRQRSGPGTPPVSNFTANYYNENVNFHKVYDSSGTIVGYQDDVGHVGQNDQLAYFVSPQTIARNYPEAVLVLDIQSYDVLVSAMRVVNQMNAWDHVVFKVWSQAFPFRKQGNSFVEALPYQNGKFVISVNPTNLHLNGSVAYIDMWNPADNRAETLDYSSGVPDNGYNSVLLSIRGGNLQLIGMETFFNGVLPLSNTDKWLRDNFHISASGNNSYPTWGVFRGPDMTLPKNNVENLPAGNYSLGWDIMTLVSNDTAGLRNIFGNEHDIVVKDIQ